MPIKDPDVFKREYAAATAKEINVATGGKTSVTETTQDGDAGFQAVGKHGKTMQLTTEGIFKSLQVVQEARGKKVGGCHCLHLQLCRR